MATQSIKPAELLKRIAAAELLPRETLLEVRSELSGRRLTLQDLRQCLVTDDRLTNFQFRQLISGGLLRLGPYQLREKIGSGGMGVVYRGWHPMLRRDAAVKILRHHVATLNDSPRDAADSDGKELRRFQREIESLARLRHPRIAVAYDAGCDGDDYYLAMELIDGVDLSRLVNREGPLPVDTACHYAVQTLEALGYAHQQGLVHRDVKPSNIIAASDGIKLLDLGLASLHRDATERTKLTETGGVLGTPDFLAPEQARNATTAGPAADQYGVGATLYYLLTGEPPFPGGSYTEKILKHQSQQPPPPSRIRPDVPRQLDTVLLRLLAKAPEQRFDTADQAADALRQFSGDHAIVAVAEGRGENVRKTPDENTLAVAGDDTTQISTSDSAGRRSPKDRMGLLKRRPGLILIAGFALFVLSIPWSVLPLLEGPDSGQSTSRSEGGKTVVRKLAPEVLKPGDVNLLADVSYPYLVDAAFLLTPNRAKSDPLPVAFAWANWDEAESAASVIIRDVNNDTFSIALPTDGPIKSLAMHPTKPMLAIAGGHYNLAAAGTIEIWDVSDPIGPVLVTACAGHRGGCSKVFWWGEDRLVSVRSRKTDSPEPMVRVWDSQNGKLVGEHLQSDRSGSNGALLNQQQMLMVGEFPRRISLWSLRDWTMIWSTEIEPEALYDFCPTDDESLVLIATGNNDGSKGSIYLMDIDQLAFRRIHSSDGDVTDLRFVTDRKEVVWATGDGQRKHALFDPKATEVLYSITSLESEAGWKWFEEAEETTGIFVCGGSGTLALVGRKGEKSKLLDLATPLFIGKQAP